MESATRTDASLSPWWRTLRWPAEDPGSRWSETMSSWCGMRGANPVKRRGANGGANGGVTGRRW